MKTSLVDRIILLTSVVMIALTYPETGTVGTVQGMRLISFGLFGYSVGCIWG
jgi:hypothetical protein